MKYDWNLPGWKGTLQHDEITSKIRLTPTRDKLDFEPLRYAIGY